MENKFVLFLMLSALPHVFAEKATKPEPVFMQKAAPKVRKESIISPKKKFIGFKAFTGKVNGNAVRMRLKADIESDIIRELEKNEFITVLGQHGDFYAVAPPADMKAFVFRSFILDNVVEGNRVNVRLSPDLNAHVVGHLDAGDKILGSLCSDNNKWYKIAPPQPKSSSSGCAAITCTLLLILV